MIEEKTADLQVILVDVVLASGNVWISIYVTDKYNQSRKCFGLVWCVPMTAIPVKLAAASKVGRFLPSPIN